MESLLISSHTSDLLRSPKSPVLASFYTSVFRFLKGSQRKWWLRTLVMAPREGFRASSVFSVLPIPTAINKLALNCQKP